MFRAWDYQRAMKSKSLQSPTWGDAAQSGKAYPTCLRLETTRLTLVIFILLGLMFGTSLGYLALAALCAANSTDDETAPVTATNPPQSTLGDGWEYVYYAAEEHPAKIAV
jgi:hypothetical protein